MCFHSTTNQKYLREDGSKGAESKEVEEGRSTSPVFRTLLVTKERVRVEVKQSFGRTEKEV